MERKEFIEKVKSRCDSFHNYGEIPITIMADCGHFIKSIGMMEQLATGSCGRIGEENVSKIQKDLIRSMARMYIDLMSLSIIYEEAEDFTKIDSEIESILNQKISPY